MIGTVLGFIKNYKGITSVFGILVAVGSLYGVYVSVKADWYEQGVTDTVRQYELKVIGLQQAYNSQLETELKNYRSSMNKNFANELNRIKTEKIVETEIQKVIEYVDREIEIPVACDTVPVNFSRLLNESITTINNNAITSSVNNSSN